MFMSSSIIGFKWQSSKRRVKLWFRLALQLLFGEQTRTVSVDDFIGVSPGMPRLRNDPSLGDASSPTENVPWCNLGLLHKSVMTPREGTREPEDKGLVALSGVKKQPLSKWELTPLKGVSSLMGEIHDGLHTFSLNGVDVFRFGVFDMTSPTEHRGLFMSGTGWSPRHVGVISLLTTLSFWFSYVIPECLSEHLRLYMRGLGKLPEPEVSAFWPNRSNPLSSNDDWFDVTPDILPRRCLIILGVTWQRVTTVFGVNSVADTERSLSDLWWLFDDDEARGVGPVRFRCGVNAVREALETSNVSTECVVAHLSNLGAIFTCFLQGSPHGSRFLLRLVRDWCKLDGTPRTEQHNHL